MISRISTAAEASSTKVRAVPGAPVEVDVTGVDCEVIVVNEVEVIEVVVLVTVDDDVVVLVEHPCVYPMHGR
jgi:hypothetical protein